MHNGNGPKHRHNFKKDRETPNGTVLKCTGCPTTTLRLKGLKKGLSKNEPAFAQ